MKNYRAKVDEAFRTWRSGFTSAYEAVQRAQQNLDNASAWHSGESAKTRSIKTATAQLALKEAREAFDVERNRLQNELNRRIDEVRQEVAAATMEANLMDPASVDTAGLEILKSGVMAPADYAAFTNRYKSDPTMQRLLARYATVAADSAEDSKTKAQLLRIASDTQQNLNADTVAFETLASAAMRLSGQSTTQQGRAPADLVLSLADKWESLTDSGEN